MQSVIDEIDEETLLDHGVQTDAKNRGTYKHSIVRFAYRAAAGLIPGIAAGSVIGAETQRVKEVSILLLLPSTAVTGPCY